MLAEGHSVLQSAETDLTMPGLCLEDTLLEHCEEKTERSASASALWESVRASPPGATRGIRVLQQVGEEQVAPCSDQ